MLKRFMLAAVLVVALIYPAVARYVRKQVEPDFFMPESVRQQPEKLPIPRYMSGEEETIKAVQPEPEPRRGMPQAVSEEVAEPEVSTDETAPEYQQKYDDYNHDLEQINQQGQIPDNQNLTNDLQQMNSNQRQVVERKAYKSRNAREKFDRTLNESLF